MALVIYAYLSHLLESRILLLFCSATGATEDKLINGGLPEY